MVSSARKTDASTKFNEALWRGKRASTRALDPNVPDRWDHMPLAWAAQYGDATAVAALLDLGADVDARRKLLTPLAYATRRGALDIIHSLRAAGARPTAISQLYTGKVTRGAALLVDEEGTPLLHHAAQSLRPPVVVAMLAAGADVAAVDRNGETALHRLANLRQIDGTRAAAVATVLLDGGAPIDARNLFAVTPLHDAVRARNLAVARVLLARGADPNARDRRGSSVLDRARSSTGAGGTRGIDATPFVELLVAHGATVERRNRAPR